MTRSPATTTDLFLLTNADFGNAKGIDLRLNRRFGQLFNGTLGYSYTSAASTGSDPYTYLTSEAVVNRLQVAHQPPPQAIAPTALSRPHNLMGSLALTFPDRWNAGSTIGAILQNFQVFVVFRFASGTAYTGCQNANGNQSVRTGDACSRAASRAASTLVRLPSFKQFDMRFVKGFSPGPQPALAVPRCAQYPQLHQRADPVRRHPQHHQPGRSAEPVQRRQ